MGYSPHGHARISSRNPQALGVCQRCGFTYNRVRLLNQLQWQGLQLQPLNVWVCPDCWDEPQEQLRTIILPPDPIPIELPFPEPYSVEVNTPLTTTMASDAIFGASSLNVEDATGFSLDQQISVTLDNGVYWVATITSVDTIGNLLGIAPALPYVASVGQSVSVVNGS